MKKAEEIAQSEIIENIEEIIKRNSEKQIEIMKLQFEELSRDPFRMFEGKIDRMETEMEESKTRNLLGLGKPQIP